MALLFDNIFKKKDSPGGKVNGSPKQEFTGYSGGQYRPLFAWTFNGEKNLGEIGPIKAYVIDYEALRLRSWQSYLESEITQTIINKRITWAVGSGLKLQAEPDLDLLKSEGIKMDAEKFSGETESRFRLYADSKFSDYSQMNNLNHIQNQAMLNAIVGGDVLVILRYENDTISVQLIDGTHIISPLGYGTEWYPHYLPNGNRIVYGIELSPTGEHVAYYVRKPGFVFASERVPAKTESGLTVAFMVYGSGYRIDNMRGIPLVSVVLESLKKLERYKEATLGSAEERQKIAYQIVHKENASGESPLMGQLAKAHDIDVPRNEDLPRSIEGKQLADNVAATTNKMTFNMSPGSELQQLESKNELYFKDFYNTHYELICSAVGIPPEVANAKYDSNFSASRAALKDWEHSLGVIRRRFTNQFLKHVYALWLHVNILQNKIDAPGYIMAFIREDWMVLEAYRKARFVGAPVPHIDPEKEVRAERMKLGLTADAIPLTTVEAATEALNGGDSNHNLLQFSKELQKANSVGVKIPEPPKPAAPAKKPK